MTHRQVYAIICDKSGFASALGNDMEKPIAIGFALAMGFFALGAGATVFSQVGFEQGEGYPEASLLTNSSREQGDPCYYWCLGSSEAVGTVMKYESAPPAGGGEQYLQLNTDETPIYRTVLGRRNTPYSSLDQAVATNIEEGIFFDADVQIVVGTEPPELDDDTKFAIWALETNSGETNLMVTAGHYSFDDGCMLVTNFTLACAADFDFDAWHRLTVRVIEDVGPAGCDYFISGFLVFIDRELVAAADEDYAARMGFDDDYLDYLAESMYEYYEYHQLFFSAAAMSEEPNRQLTAVGLQGTGKIDNLKILDWAHAPDFSQQEIAYFKAIFIYGFSGEHTDEVSVEEGNYVWPVPEIPKVTGYKSAWDPDPYWTKIYSNTTFMAFYESILPVSGTLDDKGAENIEKMSKQLAQLPKKDEESAEEASDQWLKMVYDVEDGKIPAAKLNATSSKLVELSVNNDIPIVENEPTFEVEAVPASAGNIAAFEFTLKDGKDEVAIQALTQKVKEMVKFTDSLTESFGAATSDKVEIKLDQGKLRVEIKERDGVGGGFMKLEPNLPAEEEK